VASDPVNLGFTIRDTGSATVTCPGGTVVVGGGGIATGGEPYTAAITAALPQQEANGFHVEFTRVLEVIDQEFGTQILAYAICAEINPAG
jgi:hypothetical protein